MIEPNPGSGKNACATTFYLAYSSVRGTSVGTRPRSTRQQRSGSVETAAQMVSAEDEVKMCGLAERDPGMGLRIEGAAFAAHEGLGERNVGVQQDVKRAAAGRGARACVDLSVSEGSSDAFRCASAAGYGDVGSCATVAL